MQSKSEKTKQFIIKKSAPIFNKYGYAATGLSDITKATGLTKGAIYGNFENKEEIALEAFNFNMKNLLREIKKHMDLELSPLKKLYKLTNFFRNYHILMKEFGGCPIINVGIDSKNQNPLLHERVKYSIRKIIGFIEDIIVEGIDKKEIKTNINPEKWAIKIFTIIEGSVFMMSTTDKLDTMNEMMEHLELMLETKFKL